MSIISWITIWLLMNQFFITKRIEEMTKPEKKNNIEPISTNVFVWLFSYVLGVFSFLFLKQLRRFKKIRYEKQRLSFLKSYMREEYEEDIRQLERSFKLRKISKEAKINNLKRKLLLK